MSVIRNRQSMASVTLLTLITLLTLAPLATAQLTLGPINWSGNSPVCFAGAGVTNGGIFAGPTLASNVAWFCTSARGLGAPRVTSLTFSSDIAANNLQVYACTNIGSITNAGLSGTNQLWMDGTGFASNDVIVLRSVLLDQYQRCVITNWSQSSIMIWPSAGFATTNNNAGQSSADLVYKMTPLFTLNSVPGGTTNYPNYGTIVGREGLPLLMDIGFSNNAAIKAVVGDYIHRN